MQIKKINTPKKVLGLLIGPNAETCVTHQNIENVMDEHLKLLKNKFRGVDVLIYPPDTRITESGDYIAIELEILRETLDRVRMQIAEKIRRSLDCKVILTNQPLDNLTSGYSTEKWHSERNYPAATPRIKTKRIPNPELLTELPEDELSHPNILFENRYRISENSILVRRPYLPGITTLDNESHLPIKAKLRILIDALGGNLYLHYCGFVHCDVKPSNIFIQTTQENDLVGMIGDLEGILEQNSNNTSSIPIYTPQFHEESYFPKADIKPIDYSRDSFAWAITLAYVLTDQTEVFSTAKIPNIEDWFSSEQKNCPKYSFLIEQCKLGIGKDRSQRPTLETYKEALLPLS